MKIKVKCKIKSKMKFKVGEVGTVPVMHLSLAKTSSPIDWLFSLGMPVVIPA